MATKAIPRKKPSSRSKSQGNRVSSGGRLTKINRVCLFCTEKKEPTFTDTGVLRKFLSDRAKIVAKARTGACSKHQRRIAKEIKYARHLSLLPFVARI